MRFGRPTLTAKPPEPAVEKVKQTTYVVKASMANGWEWTWTYDAKDDGYPKAKALVAKLSGDPDPHGWIRNLDDTWAYRADEIRGVVLTWDTTMVEPSPPE